MRYLLFLSVLIGGVCGKNLAQAPTEKKLLWEITGKNISTPSYLYGTIHVLCPQDLVVTEQIKQKFDATQQLYLELDFDDPSIPKTFHQTTRKSESSVGDAPLWVFGSSARK